MSKGLVRGAHGINLIAALGVFVGAEWLRDQLFRWSGVGVASIVGIGLLCAGYVQICISSSTHWQTPVAAIGALSAAIGWWALWAKWLMQPVTEPSHRLIIPLMWCVLTSWLFLEWATSTLVGIWQPARAPRAELLRCWLPILALAGDLWGRVLLVHPSLGLAVMALWAVNRRRPLRRTA